LDWEGPRKISSLLRRPSHAMGAFRKAAVLLAGAARIPRITFPVRMINGTRVSDLPAAEAKAFAQKAAKKAKSANAEAMFLAQHGARHRPAPIPANRGGPKRRILTDAEMECVQLGGAPP